MGHVTKGARWALRTAMLALATVGTLSATRAEAQPIVFAFSGFATGDLAGAAFAGTPFTVTIPADVSTLGTFPGNPGTSGYLGLTGTVALDGIGTATFTEPLYVFLNPNGPTIGFGNDVNFDLIDIMDPALAGYDLMSSIGPIDAFGVYANAQFTDVATSLGPLTFASVLDRRFEAVVPSAVVPEPGTSLLVATGLAVVGAAGVRRRRGSRA